MFTRYLRLMWESKRVIPNWTPDCWPNTYNRVESPKDIQRLGGGVKLVDNLGLCLKDVKKKMIMTSVVLCIYIYVCAFNNVNSVVL